jgi:hypothetical protein
MAMPPNIENYTVPGGVRLFFDDGTGERDLGNIVNFDITPNTTELEHYTNRSGKRARDLVLSLEEKLTMKFTLDEPVIENWRFFLKGDSIEDVGAGTGAIVDLKKTLSGELFTSVGQYYGLTAYTVRQFVDYCLQYDNAVYTDNSVEVDTAGGTPFTGAATASTGFLYIGKLTPFKNLYFDVQTTGTYVTPKWEYWNGSAWTEFSPTGESDFSQDGNMALGTLSGWALKAVNSISAYWVRFSAGTVTQAATINSIRQDLVEDTDYEFDPGQSSGTTRLPGRVARISTGKLADGEEVKVSFTYVTVSSRRFAIASAEFIQGAARIEVHPAAGRGLQFDIEIPLCQLKPNGSINIDDKKFLEMNCDLEVLDNTNATPTYPFGRFVIYE